MAVQAQPATDASPSPWTAVARAVALLTVAVSVLLTAFAWPSVRSSVHDVPIAVAGPAPAVRQISAALDERLRDLVPLPADDPRGAGLAAAALPLVMGGLLAAFLLTRLVLGTTRRVIGALAFAVTGGLALGAILQFWLGSLTGSYWANTGAVALTIAATSLTILGLECVLGYTGLGLGAATMMLIGNPLSGTATAPEMLPGWSGTLGQLLPPGAGGRLLRSTAFFDSHHTVGARANRLAR
jgi:hypothetical protein